MDKTVPAAGDPGQRIHSKIVELARGLGKDASKLRYDEEIPSTGLLDSGAIMELVVWYEMEFGIDVSQDDLTLDTFGTIDAMSKYLSGSTINAVEK
jgi:D-alanine--poly(phosphoribitol) ligase subunit 2